MKLSLRLILTLVLLGGVAAVYAGQLLFEGVPVDITSATNENIVIAPGEGGVTQIGDKTGGTKDIATSNDDLFITGNLETEGQGRIEGALTVNGAATVSGASTLNGAVTLGDATSDDVTLAGRLASHVIPKTDSAYDLGSSSLAWGNLYVDAIKSTTGNDLSLAPVSGQGLTSAVTRSAATGDETLYSLSGTANKATSGNYTGLKLNVTETAAPGSADKLLDLQVGGTSWLQAFNGANSANYGVLSLGSGKWDGSTTGYFAGSSNGTLLAGNAASGFTGNLLDFQVAGSSVFKVDASGNVTQAGAVTQSGNLDMGNNLILNVGNASTDFTTGGGLTLAGALVANGNTTLGDASVDSVTVNAGTMSVPNSLNIDANTLYVDATNDRVGIGTAAPTEKFHIKASDATRIRSVIENTSTAQASLELKTAQSAGSDFLLYIPSASTDLRFNSTSGDLVTIQNAGNVGIGTTTPSMRLQVTSASGATANSLFTTNDFNSGTSAGSAFEIDFGASSGNTYSRLSASSAGSNAWNNLVLQSGGGNVGIGTAGPLWKLNVQRASGAIDTEFGFNDQAGNKVATLGVEGVTTNDLLFGTIGTMRFYTNSTLSPGSLPTNEVMRITSGGNVGIGTTSPGEKLAVTGTASFSSRVGIGGASTPSRLLWVSGSGNTSGTSQYGQVINNVYGSDATANGVGIYLAPTTAAASFTMATWSGVYVDNPGKGTGSTITTLQAFNANDLTDGTNNYGFRGQLTSGANKYNLYMDGTAQNYIAGNVGIGTASPAGNSLTLGALGTADATTPGYHSRSLTLRGSGWTGVAASNVDLSLQALVGSSTNYGLALSQAPAATTQKGVLSLGSGAWDGTTAGFFAGSSSGTLLAGNAASGFAGNLLDLQVAGSSKFKVDANGNLTLTGTQTNSGLTAGSVVFAGTGGALSQNNANFFWDNTNARLGIGTTSPGDKLQIASGHVRLTDDFGYRWDVNTGWYGHTSPSSAVFAQTSAVTRLFIDNNGNVGIGTTAPVDLLHISANTAGTPTIGGLKVENRGGTNTPYVEVRLEDIAANVNSIVSNGGLLFETGGSGSIFERMRITNTGNVGIGTTSPAYPLVVAPSTAPTNSIYALIGTGTGNSRLMIGNADAVDDSGVIGFDNANNNLAMWVSGGPVNTFVLKSSGNVGIGTTTPGYTLHVQGDIASQRSGGTLFTVQTPSTDARLLTNSAVPMILGANSNLSQLVLASGGNVGIGTTSPLAKLQVGSSASAGNSIDHSLSLGGGSNDAAAPTNEISTTPQAGERILLYADGTTKISEGFDGNNWWAKNQANAGDDTRGFSWFTRGASGFSEKMRITGAGNVGIGTASPAGNSLTLGALGTADATTPGYHSRSLTLRGSGWTGVAASNVDLSLQALVGSSTNYGLALSQAPAATTQKGVLSLGSGAWDGTTAGFFAGSASGTLLAGNAASGFAGNLLDLQVAGSSKFKVDASGNLTLTGTQTNSGLTAGSVVFAGTGGALSQNNANFFWDNTNARLGIGTTGPSRALQVGVSGSWSDTSGILVKGSNPGIEIADTQATPQRWLIANGVNSVNDGKLGLAYDINAALHRIVVLPGSGNVGIGRTGPNYPLQLTIPFTATDTTRRDLAMFGSNDANAWGLWFSQIGNAAIASRVFAIQTTQATVGSDGILALQPDGGKVGIGTTSPSNLLTLASGSNARSLMITRQGVATEGVMLGLDSSANGRLKINNADMTFGIGNNTNDTTQWVEYMRIQNGGNVGIGTTAPNIAGYSTVTLTVKGSSNRGNLELASDAADANGLLLGVVGFSSANNTAVGAAKNVAEIFGLTDGTTLNNRGGALTFNTRANAGAGTIERMRIDSAGNVGIGTTSPQTLLHVLSGTTARTRFRSDQGGGIYSEFGMDAAAPNNGASVWVGATQQAHFFGGGLSLGSYVNVDPPSNGLIVSGNVGIGTTAPGRALQVGTNGAWSGTSGILVKGSNPGIEIADTQATPQRWLIANGVDAGNDGKWGLAYDINAGAHRIVVLPSSGNVGIGTTSPQANLDVTVNQAKTITTTATYGYLGKTNEASNYAALQFYMAGGAAAANRYWALQTIEQGVANAGSLVFQPNGGNVGIGTTSPGQALEVNGGARLNTATAKPTCSSTVRGTFWVTQGAAGVKDNVEVCAKDATDAYAWRTLY